VVPQATQLSGLLRLVPVFQALAEIWLGAIGVDWNVEKEYIVDSCPIILAKGARSGHAKVARELCEKSYNSSTKEWYYGIKLHAVVARRPGRLPLPLSLMISGAAQHDLPAAKQILEDHISLKQGRLYADKAYIDAAWKTALKKNHAIELLTPRKKGKEDSLVSGDTFIRSFPACSCIFSIVLPLPSFPLFSTLDSHL